MVTSAVSRLGRSPEEGIKAPCKSSTTGNITLFGTGQILNGVTMNTSDRAIVKDQDFIGENGIYVVGPDAWERANDMNASEDVDNGQLVVDANSGVLYQIAVTGIWSPGNDMTFVVFLAGMPSSITLTLADPIDLVDVTVALVTGSFTPLVSPHLEFDFQAVQSKSDATTAAVLFLNPQGGDINIAADLVIAGLVDGVDVAAHAGDATIHFIEGSIDHTAVQNIGTNSHTAIDTHIADATLHFTEASIDHVNILNIGTNSHASIDTHIADATIHFTEASIDHVNILNIGSNTHAQIDTHIADATLHFTEGSIDHTAIANIGTNSHAAIDTHIADATLHFTEASIDHTAIGNIGTNSHAAIDTHIADATIHFTEASITITASQVSDFDTEVANEAAVVLNTAKIGLVNATTTELEDITDAINTAAAKELGFMVLNTTTGLTVFAAGSADGSLWHFYDETTAHTPV